MRTSGAISRPSAPRWPGWCEQSESAITSTCARETNWCCSRMTAAGTRPEGRFYANLYVALYAEAGGDRARTLEHLKLAADSRYASVGGYMHMVARIHLALLEGTR